MNIYSRVESYVLAIIVVCHCMKQNIDYDLKWRVVIFEMEFGLCTL